MEAAAFRRSANVPSGASCSRSISYGAVPRCGAMDEAPERKSERDGQDAPDAEDRQEDRRQAGPPLMFYRNKRPSDTTSWQELIGLMRQRYASPVEVVIPF